MQLGLDTKRLSGSRGLRINKGQLTVVVSLPKLSLLKCSSGAVIRCTGIFKGGTVQLRASSGGMVDGLSLKASEALIDASSGGVIRITGSTRILTVNKSRSGGNINTDGYTVSYRVQ